jgi:protein-S-isoprenylcysteine O-methyltransferase Ste14
MSALSIATIISLIFFLSEMTLMITMHSKKKTVVSRKDRGSMILLWVMICLCLTVGFNIAGRSQWTGTSKILAIFGYMMLLAGFTIRWTAILQLRKAFTVDVSFSEGQELKSDGLYKNIRHPSYLGLLLILSGLSLAMGNIWSVLVVTIPMFLTINYRIVVEERLLTTELGEAYSQYKSRTSRLFPGIY